MSWFYRDGDKEVGPLGKAEMREAVRAGKITDNTLVKSERSSQWKTLRQIRAEARLKSAGSQRTSGGAAGVGGDSPQMDSVAKKNVVCAECGRSFAEDDVINYKGHNIFAS